MEVHGELVINAIVASVDDKPITLSDLSARLSPPRKLTLSEAAKDPEAQKALDQMINEKLLEEEAKTKRVTVNDLEVEDYINEVAQRNGLSRGQFNEALAKEGKSLASYKQDIRMEIMKAKIVSTISRGGVSTTETEVDEYISEHPELHPTTASVKLHRMTISKTGRSAEEVEVRIQQIKEALQKGDSFGNVAARLADMGQNPDSTLLGVIAQSDLSPDIQSTIEGVPNGQHSNPLETETEVQIFLVERRFTGEDEDEDEEALRAEVRQILQKQKTQQRLSQYFGEEIYKNHAIDKRL
jgi:peptidyl-prolyl cis-trans isomerase SurA